MRLPAVLVALICIALAGPVVAQEQGFGVTMTLRPGYDGAYRLGEWFPVVSRLPTMGAI